MSAAADLLLLVLRVLPRETREWLIVERKMSGKRKKWAGPSDSARKKPGSV